MTAVLTTIAPDGTTTRRDLDVHSSETNVLSVLQAAVGGWIETVPGLTVLRTPGRPDLPCVAFANEEGRMMCLPPNRAASELWHSASPRHAPTTLLGTVAIVTGSPEDLAAL